MKIPSLGEGKKGRREEPLFLPVPAHGEGSKGRLSIPPRPLLSHHVLLSSTAESDSCRGPCGWRLAGREEWRGRGTPAGRRRDWDCLRAAVLPAAPAAGETASNELWVCVYILKIPAVPCGLLHCILTHVQTVVFLPFLFHFTRNNPCCSDALHLTSKPVFFCCLPLDVALHLMFAHTPAVFTQFTGRLTSWTFIHSLPFHLAAGTWAGCLHPGSPSSL